MEVQYIHVGCGKLDLLLGCIVQRQRTTYGADGLQCVERMQYNNGQRNITTK